MEKAYRPCVWDLPDDFCSYEAFYRCLENLDRSSSPGYPYMRESPTIGEWLGWNGVWYDPIKIERLWFDVQQVLARDYDMYLRCFIKSEPHKIEKVKENRWRLIMASPLCVQMVWHMMFSYQNDLEIREAYNIPSQQGFVPVNGGWQQYLAQWKQKGYDTGLDKKAWDWNAPGWLIFMELEFRFRMGRGAKMDLWYEIARWLYHCMFVNPKIILSSGLVIQQLFAGIVKSGCVNTISLNSHCQVLVHIGVCIRTRVCIYPDRKSVV